MRPYYTKTKILQKGQMKRIRRRKATKNGIAKSAIKSIGQRKAIKPVEFLGSGSTTLNLALSGRAKEGWARGRVLNIVGDGSSGKTLVALELAFWCYKNIKKIKSKLFPKAKKIQLVYLNAEGVMDFPLEKMYGKDFKQAITWRGNESVEAMGRDYVNRLNKLKKGEFLLYIIDSWDALQSIKDHQRFAKSIKDNKEMEGSFNLDKQKYANKFFGYVCSIADSDTPKDATLFIVSQVRKKIGVSFGKKTYRAGGDALNFYTHQVAWIREVEKITKTKDKEKRIIAIKTHVKIERSKVAKPFRESNFQILYDYGLDDLGSMIDYIWGKNKIRFNRRKFKNKELFIKYIEENNLENELIQKTAKKWANIESSFEREVSDRKPRH